MWVDGRLQYAHRVMYEMTFGPISPGLSVCHRCDMPACVRPDHLFLGTHTDNMQDCSRKGRKHGVYGNANGMRKNPGLLRGTKNGCAKLDEDKVRQIRSLTATGVSWSQLALRFGVSKSAIMMIVTGRKWAWVRA